MKASIQKFVLFGATGDLSQRMVWPSLYHLVREKLVPAGAEYISVWDAMCNADGCLARIGDSARDISASDQVHLTEKGSEFLIEAIIGPLLGGPAPTGKPC